MPELPEVEGYRKYLVGTALHQTITGIETINEGRMLRKNREAVVEASLGQQFVETSRIGKFLFLHLSSGWKQLWHFGLTGEPKYYPKEEETPRFARIIFEFENGFNLAFCCLRKFGRLELVKDVEEYRKAHKLGVDAQHISKADFVAALSRKRTAIKTALLQQNHFAGVGNWIADEMLFQIRLHPEVRSNEVGEPLLGELYDRMQEILTTALQLDAHYKEFPQHFMVERRWKKGNCPRCETPLVRIEVGGRGTYLCPTCQVA